MIKKYLYILIATVTINILIYVLILPYAQKTANSHINAGPFFGAIFYFASAVLLIIGLYGLFSDKNYKLFFLYFMFAITLILWGFKFHSLMCLGCLNSG